MRNVDLKIKAIKMYTLPKGGWLVADIPDRTMGGRANFALVQSDGYTKKLGRAVPYYSPKLNEFILQDNSRLSAGNILWSESGNVTTTTNNKFIRARDSVHYSNGTFVSIGTDVKKALDKLQAFKGLHRRLPHYLIGIDSTASNLLMAAIPDFTVAALSEGSKHKDAIFFLRVSTGENVSIQAVGLGKLRDALPSSDGLTALVIDNSGKGLLVDNPL